MCYNRKQIIYIIFKNNLIINDIMKAQQRQTNNRIGYQNTDAPISNDFLMMKINY